MTSSCNITSLEGKFWNSVSAILLEGNSSWKGGWIVRPVIQHKKCNLTEHWVNRNLTAEVPIWTKLAATE